MSRVADSWPSITALARLLHQVVEEPDTHVENDALVAALQTQGSLAHYNDPGLGITPCALNTQKAAARDYYDGGYVEFDLLRRDAKAALDRALTEKGKKKETTKSSAIKRSGRLLERWRAAMQYNTLLNGLLNEALSAADRLAEVAGGDERGRWVKERRVLTDKLRGPAERNKAMNEENVF